MSYLLFQYHAKLDGSQTFYSKRTQAILFQYHANLIGSQTNNFEVFFSNEFQYHANLIGSQTSPADTISMVKRPRLLSVDFRRAT